MFLISKSDPRYGYMLPDALPLSYRGTSEPTNCLRYLRKLPTADPALNPLLSIDRTQSLHCGLHRLLSVKPGQSPRSGPSTDSRGSLRPAGLNSRFVVRLTQFFPARRVAMAAREINHPPTPAVKQAYCSANGVSGCRQKRLTLALV